MPGYSGSEFSTKAAQTNFGNTARDSFRGPGYFDTDLNLYKTVAAAEKYKPPSEHPSSTF